MLEDIDTYQNLITEALYNKNRLSTIQVEELQQKKQDLYDDRQKIEKIKNELEKSFEKLKHSGELVANGQVLALEQAVRFTENILNSSIQIILNAGAFILSDFFAEAAALWKLSSSKFQKGREYIEKNGKLLNSFAEIKEPIVCKTVLEKLKSQKINTNVRGIRLNADSSFAQKIIDTPAFKNYIRKNRYKFSPNTKLQNDSLDLLNWKSLDEYLAIHKTDIVDIYIDFHETFTAKIIDTYDFNPGERNPLVIAGNILQEANKIENYFVIIDIVVPKETWENL